MDDVQQQFRAWIEREYPDGMGSGNGLSWWTSDDMEAAFLAGVRFGHEQPVPVPRMPPLSAGSRFDTAAALRLAGKRGEIHPADAVAFTYPDVATFERYAALNRVNDGVDQIGPLDYRGQVVGIVDLRCALPQVTDPALSDDWPN